MLSVIRRSYGHYGIECWRFQRQLHFGRATLQLLVVELILVAADHTTVFFL